MDLGIWSRSIFDLWVNPHMGLWGAGVGIGSPQGANVPVANDEFLCALLHPQIRCWRPSWFWEWWLFQRTSEWVAIDNPRCRLCHGRHHLGVRWIVVLLFLKGIVRVSFLSSTLAIGGWRRRRASKRDATLPIPRFCCSVKSNTHLRWCFYRWGWFRQCVRHLDHFCSAQGVHCKKGRNYLWASSRPLGWCPSLHFEKRYRWQRPQPFCIRGVELGIRKWLQPVPQVCAKCLFLIVEWVSLLPIRTSVGHRWRCISWRVWLWWRHLGLEGSASDGWRWLVGRGLESRACLRCLEKSEGRAGFIF